MLLLVSTAEIWVNPCKTAITPFQKAALSLLAMKVYGHHV